MLIPGDCADGFYHAYWRRPAAYLDERVRRGISIWARVGPEAERRVVQSCSSPDRGNRTRPESVPATDEPAGSKHDYQTPAKGSRCLADGHAAARIDRPGCGGNPSADDYGLFRGAVNDSQQAMSSPAADGAEAGQAWLALAPDYERARAREDSLDRLVEWPAQRDLLGDVTGLSVLDAGCGNGGKLTERVRDGATASVGVDISGNFLTARPPDLEFIRGDLSDLDSVPGLAGRTFDRILFLQSFGYAKDPVRTLQAARAMLADDGFILLSRTQPIRYAVERAEQNGTSLGEEYFSAAPYTYRTGWNDQVALTKRTYTISGLINVFSAAGLWIETAIEPQLSEDARRRYPHKQAWLNKYLGILIFKLRPRP